MTEAEWFDEMNELIERGRTARRAYERHRKLELAARKQATQAEEERKAIDSQIMVALSKRMDPDFEMPEGATIRGIA